MRTPKLSATLIALLVAGSSIVTHQAKADNATITDGDDSGSVLDVHSVAISNTTTAVTYLITLDNFTASSDLRKIRMLLDFNNDQVPDNCLNVSPSSYASSGLQGTLMESQTSGPALATKGDCAGDMLVGTADVAKPAGNQVQIVVPLVTLRAAGLGPSAQSYGVAVDTQDATNGSVPFTPNDRAPDGAAFVTHTLVSFKPDATIQSSKQSSPIGNDVYNTDGSQKSTLKLKPKKTGTWTIVVQNDASADDTIHVAGCGDSTGYTVSYSDGGNVTAGVEAGTYSTGTLAPGASKTITLTIATTKKTKKSKTCDVEVTSVGTPAAQDLVRAVLKIIK